MREFDVLVIGGGLAGLVAATEAADRGLKVGLIDQEGEQNLGGQGAVGREHAGKYLNYCAERRLASRRLFLGSELALDVFDCWKAVTLLVPPDLPRGNQKDRGQCRRQYCIGAISSNLPPMNVPATEPAAMMIRNVRLRLSTAKL